MAETGIYLRLLCSVLFWGGTFVAGRLLAGEITPQAAAFLRFLFASLLLLPLLHYREKQLPRITLRQSVAVVLLGGSGVFAYNLFFFSGLQSVEAGRAALIIATNPVFIALFSMLLFGERFTRPKVAGILLSVLGALTVITRGAPLELLQGGVGEGELLILGCVCSWVIYTLLGKRVMRGLTPLTAVTYSCVAGTLMLSFPAYRDGLLQPLMVMPLSALLSLLYLALFGTVLGFVWYYQAVQAIGPTRAGQFINLVPVSAVLFGALLLGEPVTWSLLLGGSLVVGGLFLTNRRAK
jgi:drug/metabolite transporter (DMT)-like permease